MIVQALAVAKAISPVPATRAIKRLLADLEEACLENPDVSQLKTCSAYVAHLLHNAQNDLSSRRVVFDAVASETYR